tara:strand:- start:3792 stop:4199 length:408 start_codon:yes stop_codon:yes gene_type:complete
MDTQLKNLDVMDSDTIRSIRLNNYILDENRYENKNKCRVEFGILGGSAVSHTKSNIVDIENDLLGITRASSKCADNLYKAPENNKVVPVDNFKTDSKPTLNLEKQHLKPCNFFNYQLIPNEPALVFDDCNIEKEK